jgi:RNA polymerase sigma factor (sigma-70 family)
MDEPDDIELLGKFVEQHSEADFAVLVRRQIDLVYSAALRQTRNPHAAEEVTQAVFVVLARKAGSLLRLSTLTGWLYQAARLTAANYLRTESRRARREQEAYMQSLINEPAPDPDEAWMQTAPLLEDAMGKLNSLDRDAVLLRYFENKSLRDVGLALGMNEDAARMRVNRALERLRRLLTRRDVTLSAVALAGVLSTKSIQAAPGTLAASVTATVAQGAMPGSSVTVLAQGTLSILAWTRYKILAGLGASAIFVAAIITTAFLATGKVGPQAARTIASRPGPITQLGPFQGTASDGFDNLGSDVTQQGISILGSTVTVSNLTRNGALKLVGASSLGGVLVTAHSSPSMLGQLGISEWVFSTPVTKFGAYFANNSRFDDATVDFYDAGDNLIGSETAKVPKGLRGWTWNGWQSDAPIHRLVVTGKDAGFLHGFIWFDDVQVATVPRPACTITCSTNIAVCNDPGKSGAVVRFVTPVATNCPGLSIVCVPAPGSFFPVGTNFVVCAAMDGAGHVTNACTFGITVRDCEPPVIHSIAASPEVLWPNHKMQEVTVRVAASDNCRLARCKIISVACIESSSAHGGGQTISEWQLTGDLTVNLRAEPPGAGTSRDYSITVECTDDSGNASTAVVHVTVPHDQSPRTVPLRPPSEKVQYARQTDAGAKRRLFRTSLGQ